MVLTETAEVHGVDERGERFCGELNERGRGDPDEVTVDFLPDRKLVVGCIGVVGERRGDCREAGRYVPASERSREGAAGERMDGGRVPGKGEKGGPKGSHRGAQEDFLQIWVSPREPQREPNECPKRVEFGTHFFVSF